MSSSVPRPVRYTSSSVEPILTPSTRVDLLAPRIQSDIMIVAGTLTNKMAPSLRKVYDQVSLLPLSARLSLPPLTSSFSCRCPSPAGSSRWARAPTVAATTTTRTRSFAVATGSSPSTSTSRGARPPPRLCCEFVSRLDCALCGTMGAGIGHRRVVATVECSAKPDRRGFLRLRIQRQQAKGNP